MYCQPQFSQPYLVPFYFNPSLTGNFPGDYRIGGIYHNEKGNFSPLAKFTFFGEVKCIQKVLPETDRLNIALSAMGEKDVFNGIYNNYFGLMMSYFKSINVEGTEKIGIGFGAIYSDKKIDPPLLIFEDQIEAWLRNGFTGINPFERHQVRYQYIDISAGINYQNVILVKYKISVGAAVLHANRPSGKLSEGAFELPSELSLQSGIDRAINTKNKSYLRFHTDLFSWRNKR